MRCPSPAEARAALWTVRAVVQARRKARRTPIDRIRLSPPPALPDEAIAGVAGVLRRWPQSCLIQALVRQRWHASHGRSRDLVIGVTAPSAGFRAHAWLADDDRCHHREFTELLRTPAPSSA
jgi:hypothetical protein